VPPPPHQSVTTFIATVHRQVLEAKWKKLGQKRHRRLKRGVREHRKCTKAHLRPVKPVGRPNMGGGGGREGRERHELRFGPKRVHTDRCSNVGCLNYEAPPPAEAGRSIWECVPPATERKKQVLTVSARRPGRLYGAPLVAIA